MSYTIKHFLHLRHRVLDSDCLTTVVETECGCRQETTAYVIGLNGETPPAEGDWLACERMNEKVLRENLSINPVLERIKVL